MRSVSRVERVLRRDADAGESARAMRSWWDVRAGEYYAEHGAYLGDADFVWSPENFRERDVRLLGDPERDLVGHRVLEVGCGAAQCSRWLLAQGARPVAFDVSAGQLLQGRDLGARTKLAVPLVQADAQRLPFRDESFDLACSAYGAVPFVADSAAVMREVARVLRPGGRWVFATTHPFRWCFLDDPGPGGLVVESSYFDRRAYVEENADGEVTYVEHHRTVGDRVREIVAAGLVLDDLVEPEWPDDHELPWGQWSPLRGRVIPGTAIFVTHKP